MNVLPERLENTRLIRQDAHSLARTDSKEGRHGSREDEGGAIDTLVIDDDPRACTESSCGAESIGHGPNQHVDGGGGDIVQLCETTASTTDSAERVRFVEDKPVLILLLELDLENGVGKRG